MKKTRRVKSVAIPKPYPLEPATKISPSKARIMELEDEVKLLRNDMADLKQQRDRYYEAILAKTPIIEDLKVHLLNKTLEYERLRGQMDRVELQDVLQAETVTQTYESPNHGGQSSERVVSKVTLQPARLYQAETGHISGSSDFLRGYERSTSPKHWVNKS